MKFDDFARKVVADPDLTFQLIQAAWKAQKKIQVQLADGDMKQSRAEYDALVRFFDGVDAPKVFRDRFLDNA